ncbi:MAG: DUF5050 domain-containing protein [Clostridia bacterium]|nr:DUF5050 domain-containing protein [Clostridia bacterium]
MKKFCKPNRLFIILLACVQLLLSAALYGCADEIAAPPDDSVRYAHEPTTNVMQYQSAVCWNQYVVTSGGTIYNRATGEVRDDFCTDETCEGDCYLERSILRVETVADGKVYFTLRRSAREGIRYCSYDLQSGQIMELVCIDYKDRAGSAIFVDNGWMYYTRGVNVPLQTGGTSYGIAICRIPVEGGESEQVYTIDHAKVPYLIKDGNMYTMSDDVLLQIKIASGKQTTLASLEDAPIRSVVRMDYVDGRILLFGYYSYNTTLQMVITIDVASGTWHEMVDVPVANYYIEQDTVYFLPCEDRLIGGADSDHPTYASVSATLYACDLDGGNIRPIWTDKSGRLDYSDYYAVVDGIIYAWIREYDPETQAYTESYFAEIRTKTDEIIPATVVNK